MEYDPLLGKLCTWAATRDAAIARMQRALHELQVHGTTTNTGMLTAILRHPDFRAGQYATDFLTRYGDALLAATSVAAPEDVWLAAGIAGALAIASTDDQRPAKSRWRTTARQEGVQRGPVV